MSKTRIAVVDDDRGAAELIQMMLNVRGYEVRAFSSGDDALHALVEMAKRASPWRSFPIDLVLLDIMMPGMDGFKVCQTIKHDPELRTVPVIMLTALDNASDKIAAIQFGADDYITKPFLPEELHAAIQAKLAVKRREIALLRRNAELETINAVAAAASSTLDPQRVAEEGFAALVTHTDLPAAVYVLDEEQRRLQLVAKKGVERPASLPVDRGLPAKILRCQQPSLKVELRDDPDLPAETLGEHHPRSFVGVPLRAIEQSLGVLEVYHPEPYGFPEEAATFFTEIGDRLGMALQNAEIFRHTQALLREFSALRVGSL